MACRSWPGPVRAAPPCGAARAGHRRRRRSPPASAPLGRLVVHQDGAGQPDAGLHGRPPLPAQRVAHQERLARSLHVETPDARLRGDGARQRGRRLPARPDPGGLGPGDPRQGLLVATGPRVEEALLPVDGVGGLLRRSGRAASSGCPSARGPGRGRAGCGGLPGPRIRGPGRLGADRSGGLWGPADGRMGEKGRCPRALLRPRPPRGPAAAWDGIAPLETPSAGSGPDPGDSCAPPALSVPAPPGVLALPSGCSAPSVPAPPGVPALPSGCSAPSAPSFPRARKPGPGAGVPPSW